MKLFESNQSILVCEWKLSRVVRILGCEDAEFLRSEEVCSREEIINGSHFSVRDFDGDFEFLIQILFLSTIDSTSVAKNTSDATKRTKGSNCLLFSLGQGRFMHYKHIILLRYRIYKSYCRFAVSTTKNYK